MAASELLSKLDFDSWLDGLLFVDSEGCLLELNRSAERLLGWGLEEIKGRSVHEILCRNSIYTDHHENACPLCQLKDKQLSPVEAYWTHKNAENIPVSYRRTHTADGQVVIVFSTCEQQGFQVEELRKLSQFTEINPSPLLELDAQGLIHFSNPAMTELMLEFGFNDEGAPAILPCDLPELVARAIAEQGLVTIESSAIDEDDASNVRYFLWSFHPIENSQNESVLLCGLDITSKKELETQRIAYERGLEQEKERVRKEYLAKMVHELRSPLNAVVGYAGILKLKLAKSCNEMQLSLFDRIIDGGNQLAEQISATLDSTRVEAGKMQADITRFDSGPLLREVCERFVPLAEQKGLSLLLELPDCEMPLLSDKLHFKQIAINLISNAIKYTEQGQVSVYLREAVDPQIGKCVVLDVCDTGYGVPEAQRETIFQLYQRQDSHESSDIEGDGYGLAIVCEMLELNHGRIKLDSELGKGSTFSAIFPR